MKSVTIVKSKSNPLGLQDVVIALSIGGVAYFGAKLMGIGGSPVSASEASIEEGTRTGTRTEAQIEAEARDIIGRSPEGARGPNSTAKDIAKGLAIANPNGAVLWAAGEAARALLRSTFKPATWPLAEGMQGEAIAQMQIWLNKLGASLIPDGKWGPATTKALLRFFPGQTTITRGQHANIRQRAIPNPKLMLPGESKESWLKRNGWKDTDITAAKQLLAKLATAGTPNLKEAAIIGALKGKSKSQKSNLLIAYRRLHPQYNVVQPFKTSLTSQPGNFNPNSKLLAELKQLDK